MTARGCPVCGKSAAADYRPFCSRRCADVDLGRWLSGSYRVPTAEAPDADTDGTGPADGRD
jgi:hypothetical protein